MTGRSELWTKLLIAPIAKVVLKQAGLEEAVDTAVAALNESAKLQDADETKRKAQALAEELASEIADRHARQFTEENIPVDAEAVAKALALVFKDVAKPKSLLSRNLNPERLSQDLAKIPPPETFGTAERELYETVLPDLAHGLTAKAMELKGFDLAYRAELLARQDETNLRLERLEHSARVNRRTVEWADYEKRYRACIERENKYLELFGSDIPEEAKRQALSVAYVSLSLTRHGKGQEEQESVTADHLFDRLRGIGGRLLIRGEAGSGKTTLLRWAAVKMGEDELMDPASGSAAFLQRLGRERPQQLLLSGLLPDWRDLVPFLIRLRDCPDGLPSVAEFAGVVSNVAGPPPPDWIVKRLDSGDALVMIDGVDEVARFDRPKYAQAIGRLVAQYPRALFVVTSRPAAVPPDWLAGHGFAHAEISDLAGPDQALLVQRWHDAIAEFVSEDRRAKLKEKETRLRARLDSEPSLARLGSNPMMLAMLCALHYRMEGQLPERAFTLCDKLCTLLIDEKDRLSGLKAETIDPLWAALDSECKRSLVRDLAYHMVTGAAGGIRSSMDKENAEGVLGHALRGFGKADADVKAFRQTVVERSGMLRDTGTGRIDFLHNTLKEFLAAERFIELRAEEDLASHADDPDWRPVVVFGAGGRSRPFTDNLFKHVRDRENCATGKVRRRLRFMAWAVGAVAVQLDPNLHADRARFEKAIIPPRTFEEAELLSEAGEHVLDYLARARVGGARAMAAMVRTLRLIGSPRARDIIEQCYKDDRRKAVLDELVQAIDPLSLPAIQERLLADEHLDEGWRRLVTDVSALSGLTDLTHLDLRGTGVLDVSALSKLTNLTLLGLSQTGVTDVSTLSGLAGLTFLDLSDTGVTDVSALSGLTGLTVLGLSGTGVTDISALSGLTKLTHLGLSDTEVTDVSALSGLTNLTLLGLSGTGVTDVSALSGLTGLTHLYLSGTGVTDVSALSGLTGLTHLGLSHTRVTDVSALAGLTGLTHLDLTGTGVTDMPMLSSLPKLVRLAMPDGSL